MTDAKTSTIRAALAGDCGDIHAMLNELAIAVGDTDKFVSSIDDLRLHGFGESPLFDVLIAELDENAVGLCLYFYTFSSWMGAPGIYVQDLYVDEDQRGTGLGRRLLAQAAAAGKARGANYLRLSVDHANFSGQQFYDALGMRCRDDEHIYQADGAIFTALANGSTSA
jgi:ribosomal protein S18 acetylase RimI-like enzyme